MLSIGTYTYLSATGKGTKEMQLSFSFPQQGKRCCSHHRALLKTRPRGEHGAQMHLCIGDEPVKFGSSITFLQFCLLVPPGGGVQSCSDSGRLESLVPAPPPTPETWRGASTHVESRIVPFLLLYARHPCVYPSQQVAWWEEGREHKHHPLLQQ
uniref:Uncharacterized protein n=1 Tax=Sphaerodactylus townsendi TaxID=933632 RepID=A0ACB8E8B0_9SAUR